MGIIMVDDVSNAINSFATASDCVPVRFPHCKSSKKVSIQVFCSERLHSRPHIVDIL